MKHRDNTWEALGSKHWDMIIVGGGITGAGVAREAARCGLSVALLEQQDFSWGTSSRSSKMVHGGLRYLAMGDVTLTRHSVLERERLVKEAPGLVERMGYYFLLKKSRFPWRLAMAIVLGIYDRIAGISDHKHISKSQLEHRFNGINKDVQKGASYYTDAVTDDCRLVQRVLQEAENEGVYILNYCRVESTQNLADSANGQTNRLSVHDLENNRKTDIQARVVVNSTGAWADKLRSERVAEQRIRPLKGSHLVLRQGIIPVDSAFACSHPQDGRSVFIFPWEGLTVIGTTDLDYQGSLDTEANVSQQETDYLLQLANFFFPNAHISEQDVLSTWSGVRPVIASEKNHSNQDSAAPSKERRDHAVWDDKGLITVSGGKLTTFRLMAQDVMRKASVYIPNLSYEAGNHAVFSALTDSKMATAHPRLLGRYGTRLPQFLSESSEQELRKIKNSQYCLAECRWAIKHEHVVHLDDLLLRRTRLGLILEDGGQALLPNIKPIFQEILDWDDNQWQQELTRYQSIWQNFYSLPSMRQGKTLS